MRNLDSVDLVSGLLVLAVGAWFLVGSLEYDMGTVTRMGPGFVPFWLGLIAVVLGVLIAATAIGRSGVLPEVAWRPAGSILLAILLFGLLLPRIGLVVAAFVAAAVSILGNRQASTRMLMVTAAIIAALCWTIFIAALGLPIDPWENPF